MQIKQLFLREVGTYDDVFLRPFETDFTPQIKEDLMRATNGGRNLSRNALAKVASDILRPTADHEGVNQIAGGWGERRWAFCMVADVRRSDLTIETQYLSGYTSHDGVRKLSDNEARLDEDMEFYIDNSFLIRYNYESRGNDSRTGWRGNLTRSNQVIRSGSEINIRGNDLGTQTMTPYDVVSRRIIPSDIRDLAREENFHDMRSSFTRERVKLLRRDNTMSDVYLSRLLSASSSVISDLGHEEHDQISYLSAIQAAVPEDDVKTDYLISQLSQDTRILDERCVSYGELLDLNPDLDDIVRVFECNPRDDYVARRGDSTPLHGRDPHTLAAIMIGQALPTTMMALGCMECRFTANNDRVDPLVIFSYLEPIAKGQEIDQIELPLEASIIHTIFPAISIRNQLPVSITVDCNIFTQTVVHISIDNKPSERFVIPTFSSTSSSPLVTDSEDRLDDLSEQIEDILDEVRSTRRKSTTLITDPDDVRAEFNRSRSGRNTSFI